MRVLQIVADGKPGGGTTHVLQILKGLRHAVSFHLIAEKDSYLLREAEALGVTCHGLRFFISRFNPTLPLQLRKIALHVQPDLIHIHGGRAGFFFAFSLLTIPTVYTIHGFHFAEKPPILRRLATLAERLVFRRSSRVIFVSRYDLTLAANCKLLGVNDSPAVIYPGISLNDLSQTAPYSSRHIGFIGRLEYQKDPLLFLETMAYLPDYTATIVGSGSLASIVKQEIAKRGLGERVHMVGEFSHGEVLKILSTLNAVVLTSRWEGMPILVLESMGMGVPIISMNVCGLGEIIQNGVNGMLVDRRRGEDLAEKVEMIMKNEHLKASLVKNAKETIQEKFSIEKMLSSTLKLYKEIVTSKAGS